MSTLYWIRHGQTHLGAGQYDRLTPKGRIQSESVARSWIDREVALDHLWVGPQRRHQESAEALRAGFAERFREAPPSTTVEELGEYPAAAVLQHVLSRPANGAEGDLGADALEGARQYLAGDRSQEATFGRVFRASTRAWVRGELEELEAETFEGFRQRVEAGVQGILGMLREDANAAIVTSAGPIAAAIGMALDLRDERVLQISWALRNGCISEMLVEDGELRLSTFNAVDHFSDPVLITLR